MKTTVTVRGSFEDESINVEYETDVIHRKDEAPYVIEAKAIANMIAFLTPLHPGGVPKLAKFCLVN